MASLTNTELANSIPVIMAREALGAMFAEGVFINIVNKDYGSLLRNGGGSVDVPFLGALTANTKSADTAVTEQAPSDTKVTITPNRHREVTFAIDDYTRVKTSYDAISAYAREAGKALMTKVETDLAGLYSGLSQSITATTAAGGLTEGTFREARRLLNAAKVPQGDRWAVLHEDAESEALAIERLINKDYASNDVVPSGSLGRAYGFNVAVSQNVATATSVCKNLFIHRNAFAFIAQDLPLDGNGRGVEQHIENVGGVAVRVTMRYDGNKLRMVCTLDTLYGIAELRDDHGILVNTTEL